MNQSKATVMDSINSERDAGGKPLTLFLVPLSGRKEKPMDMVVDELDGGITNVALRGRLDTNSAEAIDMPLSVIAGAKRAVVVDLSEVDFLASLGIRVLLTSAKAVQRKGGKLALVAPEGNVLMVLKTAGMETLIPIFPERTAAIAAVAA